MNCTIKEVVASSSVLKLTIKPANGWDWLHVYLEDLGCFENSRHTGRLVLIVDGDSYSNYWSHMAKPLIDFTQNASNSYLIDKLTGGKVTAWVDATGDDLKSEIFKEIVSQRKSDDLSKEDAREIYDELEWRDLENLGAEADFLSRVYGEEWWTGLPKVESRDYTHFSKVVDLLKDGLAQHVANQGGTQ